MFLTENQLRSSDIVANSTMNRGRGLLGVNSYERELRFNPVDILRERSQAGEGVVWIDFCCGRGVALNEASAQLAAIGIKCTLYRVDLIDDFIKPEDEVTFLSGDVCQICIDQTADLITCVHGIHYLGDKLGFLAKAWQQLALGGLFAGHMDLRNVVVDNIPSRTVRDLPLSPKLQPRNIAYHRGILTMTKSKTILSFDTDYLGATPSALPHQSGITVVDSWYAQR